MAPPGRRTNRQFQCSDALWETFRRMAADQEKGVDELINDAATRPASTPSRPLPA